MHVRVSLGSTKGQRLREPVTFGLPLPKGSVRDAREWSIDGRPADLAVLDRWGDGSVRWMLVDGQVDAGPGARDAALSDTPAAEPLRALALGEPAGVVVVDTGLIRVGMQPGSGFPFASVESGGAAVVSASLTGLAIEGESGGSIRVTTRGVHVEHAGR